MRVFFEPGRLISTRHSINAGRTILGGLEESQQGTIEGARRRSIVPSTLSWVAGSKLSRIVGEKSSYHSWSDGIYVLIFDGGGGQ